VTTFLTMAYIVLVNPAILAQSGMPLPAVTAATCLSAALGSILMGVVARYPIALAPGMGLNAYFTYTVCIKMHIPWQTALGAVFLSGTLFLLLTAFGIRQLILKSIPQELYAAVACGIGLFIAFIGLTKAGLVVQSPVTLVQLGNIKDPTTALSLLGLGLMVALEIWKVKGSILIGVLTVTAAAWALGLTHWTRSAGGVASLTATAFKLDIPGAFRVGLLEIVFVFFFVDLFDNLGTLVAVTKRAGLLAQDHSIPRLNRILFSDAAATVAGSLTGTSTVTSYVESTAGVAAGGRSGITAIVTGLLFLDRDGRGSFYRHRAQCGDSSGAHSGWVDDADHGDRDPMDRAAGGRSGILDGDSHSAHLFDRQWVGIWDYCLGGLASGGRKAEPERLAPLSAGGAVPGAVFVSFGELKPCEKWFPLLRLSDKDMEKP
jgi:AGZA family xanthine/uracil permease-like MFS transporter